jgi:AraC-like DNA-binding protein
MRLRAYSGAINPGALASAWPERSRSPNDLGRVQLEKPTEAAMAAVGQAIVGPRLTKSAPRLDTLTCIVPSSERTASMRTAIRRDRLEQVRRTIDRHLTSPSLRAAFLCKTVGISRSGLYRLFEDRGGVACYIQRQRLLRAYAVLSDPANCRPILSIADEFCFADASSFSRAFKRKFGCRPSDVTLSAAHALQITHTTGKERFARSNSAVWDRAHGYWDAKPISIARTSA